MLHPFLIIGNIVFFGIELYTVFYLWDYVHGFSTLGLLGLLFFALHHHASDITASLTYHRHQNASTEKEPS